MTHTLCGTTLFAIAAAAALNGPVQAQNVMDGNLTIELGHNAGKSRFFKHMAASIGTTFNSGLGFQVDLSAGKYEQVTSTQPHAAVHLYFAPNEEWAAGAFMIGEDQRPGNYFYFGLEAAYDTGALHAEAYAAYRSDRAGTSSDGERFGLELAYTPDSWNGFGLFGGAHSESGLPTGAKSIAYAGAEYRFSNDTKLAVTLGQTNLKETVYTLGYQIDFGKGATFSRRHSQGVFDGY